ncbi:hypothetical protein [Streptomyces rhizosphaericus]|uniref:Uncharacterized protein n=1 Tax=Streptomyces rhizosphaericus TaxID=114699 RepID=A0A6G4A9D8_9ACTN|nr:hypothetical protein [Streptomyces rhizosphaericus]NEW69882.1 hypothetical protein [Streptomyces rhizosphaericus]
MTTVLPAGFQPLPFAPARGVPQQIQVQVGSRALTVVLAAIPGDLIGLLSRPRTQVVVDGTREHTPHEGPAPDDPRAAFTAAPPEVLSSVAVRPYLIVVEAGRVIGSAPVIVGRPMAFGSSESSGLVVEVLVARLLLAAGSLIEPADIGSEILAGIRDRGSGSPRPQRPAPPSEGNPYDLLV